MWLALRGGKINQILHCDWPPAHTRWCYLTPLWSTCHVPEEKFPQKPFIDQACHVMMAEYWPHYFFESWSINMQKKKEPDQYPATLTSHLVKNTYLLFIIQQSVTMQI